MKEKKLLIFGGSGLVGTACKKIFDNSKSYKIFAPTRKQANLFNLNSVKKIILEIDPDIVINAAARVGGIVANNTYRTEFILENLKININLFEALIPHNKTKIINLGSSCIYPLNAPNPIKEISFMEGKLEETNSPYAIAKISAIEIGRSLNKQFGHEIINLMPTNLYGPNDNFDRENSHVIPGLMGRLHHAKIKNDPIFSAWGDGTPKREFLFSEDLALAIKFLLENQINIDLINVGFGEEISIKELLVKIKNIVGYKGKINFDTSKPNGNPNKLLDGSLLKSLGWKPKYKLDFGLKKTYSWYLKNLK